MEVGQWQIADFSYVIVKAQAWKSEPFSVMLCWGAPFRTSLNHELLIVESYSLFNPLYIFSLLLLCPHSSFNHFQSQTTF